VAVIHHEEALYQNAYPYPYHIAAYTCMQVHGHGHYYIVDKIKVVKTCIAKVLDQNSSIQDQTFAVSLNTVIIY